MAKSNCINFNDFQMKILMKILCLNCWEDCYNLTHLLMLVIALLTLPPSLKSERNVLILRT